MAPVGVGPEEKPYHARFLKCPLSGVYYNYENRQQGIGNTGEYDQIDRFTETENGILKPILEAADGKGLLQAVRNNTAVPSPEVHQAVYECFGMRSWKNGIYDLTVWDASVFIQLPGEVDQREPGIGDLSGAGPIRRHGRNRFR